MGNPRDASMAEPLDAKIERLKTALLCNVGMDAEREEVFNLEPQHMKTLLIKSLEAHNVHVMMCLMSHNYFALATILYDYDTKWGDLCVFSGKLCRSIIDRFTLTQDIFSSAGMALKMKNTKCLAWMADRFWWRPPFCAGPFFDHNALYDACLEHLLQDDEDRFEEFFWILWKIIDEATFKAHYITVSTTGTNEHNLLRECIRANKLEHLRFLVIPFNVDVGTFRCLAREFLVQKQGAPVQEKMVAYLRQRCLA
jgi:hypothetical protein